MRIFRSRSLLPCVVSVLSLLAPARATAGLIGDTVTVTSDSAFSGDPSMANAVVTSPGIEFPTGFGSGLAGNLSIDLEDSAITLAVISTGFSINIGQFQGLRFSSLDSPGEVISGFSLTVSPRLVGVVTPSDVTFGANFLDIDLSDANFNYLPGDNLTINLQFSPGNPSAVPEPGSLALLATAAASAAGYLGWRRRRPAV